MPLGDSQPLALGAWNASDLAQTARTIVPPGANTDVPDEVRFLAGVAKLVRSRKVRAENDGGLSIFLLARLSDRTRHAWEMVPMLDSGLAPIGNRIWIVNPPVASGWFTRNEDRTDHETFNFVTDCLELGTVPTIIIDHRVQSPLLRFYRAGLSSPDEYEAISLSGGLLPLEQILDEVALAYRMHLITPESQSEEGKVWKKSSHWWAASSAEKVVQLYLKVHLSRAFPLCTIREEQTQRTGRIDLEIEEPLFGSPGTFTRHAVLELKVLRSRGAGGGQYTDQYNLDWVRKGVEQAAAYRDERGALASALCCFDLRVADSGEQCFTHVRALAASVRVTLRRWFVYASSAALRTAISAHPS